MSARTVGLAALSEADHILSVWAWKAKTEVLQAQRDELVAALLGSTEALKNWATYATKHQALLPPVSLIGTELQIERNRAALAKVQSSGGVV